MFEKFKKKETIPNTRERWRLSFDDVERTEFPSTYKLSDGRVYVSLHHGDGGFSIPGSDEDLDVATYLKRIKETLHANEILLSCCFPGSAKQMVLDIPGVRMVGTGNVKTSTFYDDKYKRLRVETEKYTETK